MGTPLVATTLKESPSCGHSPPMIYLHGRAKYTTLLGGDGAQGGGGGGISSLYAHLVFTKRGWVS